MIGIGFDPDTNSPGIAVVQQSCDRSFLFRGHCSPKVWGARALDRMPGLARGVHEAIHRTLSDRLLMCQPNLQFSLTAQDVVAAVEWQQHRPGDPRPDDIVQLNAVAGMGLTALATLSGVRTTLTTILTPLPVQWKGTVSKELHQPRILKDVANVDEMEAEFKAAKLDAKARKNAIDAVGLAIWAIRECQKSVSRLVMRSRSKPD